MIIDSKNGKYNLIVSQNEVGAIANAINYIIGDLNDELQTRTGYNVAEYKDLLKYMYDNHKSSMVFDKTYLIMISQALNEVVHGISIPNFIDEIGIPKADLKESLNQFRDFLG
jgi:hypothetical protein